MDSVPVGSSNWFIIFPAKAECFSFSEAHCRVGSSVTVNIIEGAEFRRRANAMRKHLWDTRPLAKAYSSCSFIQHWWKVALLSISIISFSKRDWKSLTFAEVMERGRMSKSAGWHFPVWQRFSHRNVVVAGRLNAWWYHLWLDFSSTAQIHKFRSILGLLIRAVFVELSRKIGKRGTHGNKIKIQIWLQYRSISDA